MKFSGEEQEEKELDRSFCVGWSIKLIGSFMRRERGVRSLQSETLTKVAQTR